MDSMKPASKEKNDILPSLTENVQAYINILDEFFKKPDTDPEYRQAAEGWEIVREAAISFTEVFDNLKDINRKEGTLPPTLH